MEHNKQKLLNEYLSLIKKPEIINFIKTPKIKSTFIEKEKPIIYSQHIITNSEKLYKLLIE
jgi:hypothetical protein